MTAKQLLKWQSVRGFSDEDAAAAVGVKLRQYQNLRRGTSRISRTMELLIKAMEASGE